MLFNPFPEYSLMRCQDGMTNRKAAASLNPREINVLQDESLVKRNLTSQMLSGKCLKIREVRTPAIHPNGEFI